MTTNDHEQIVRLWKQIHTAGLEIYLEDSETLEKNFAHEISHLQDLAHELDTHITNCKIYG